MSGSGALLNDYTHPPTPIHIHTLRPSHSPGRVCLNSFGWLGAGDEIQQPGSVALPLNTLPSPKSSYFVNIGPTFFRRH